MINTKQVTEMLQVHENTVYNMIKRGMPAYRLGKKWMFEKQEVLDWVKNNEE